jgi:acetyl esterase/lipase
MGPHLERPSRRSSLKLKYVTGKAAKLEGAHVPLASDLGCCIVSVDYRLTPETRFSGASEDTMRRSAG